jgi:hypothetical protein
MSIINYHGVTHCVPLALLPVWKRVLCRREIHAFDEVYSCGEHRLVCDACGLIVNIASIDTTYVKATTTTGCFCENNLSALAAKEGE